MDSNGFEWKAQRYLEKHTSFPSQLEEKPGPELKYSIIIPSAYEENLEDCLDSLLQLDMPRGIAEILVVLNLSEFAETSFKEMHARQYHLLLKWSERTKNKPIQIKAIRPIELPQKWAGVGMARKIGMDEAVRRFAEIGTDGLIINVDADCTVDRRYLMRIADFMNSQNHCQALSLGFIHPLDAQKSKVEKMAIALYELHLRCYINWQKNYRYPYAFHTLGSCFAVRSSAYMEQGGMNRRKAGEDFYFLHKFSRNGSLMALDEPLVYPSGRTSLRVPFGTGKAVHSILNTLNQKELYYSYNPEAICLFCSFLTDLELNYALIKEGLNWGSIAENEVLHEFLELNNFSQHVNEALSNSTSNLQFLKRIGVFLDPFCLMKFLHFAEQNGFSKIDVLQSAKGILDNTRLEIAHLNDPFMLLEAMRKLDYPDYNPIFCK